jgi:hypothetical protein
VGPGRGLEAIGDVPWATLSPGDTVLIHRRTEPYREKWVIGRSGTADAPITIRGVPDGEGRRPVIEAAGAVTAPELNYWGEERGIIKVGGSNIPADTTPRFLVIESLEVRGARPGRSFTGDDGRQAEYASNAAGIYVEKAEDLLIRDCVLSDCGNGLFIGIFGGATKRMVVEGCYLHGNGIEGSAYEHNSYTAAVGIDFRLNRYGPLRVGCGGNNLKDRSVGTVIRCNWIEGGNRQLDLVDCEDEPALSGDPAYRTTFVFGNVLLEGTDDGNSQIVHYGGDSGKTGSYRKGTLHFYGNTVCSYRSGNTTLFRLSTNNESCDCRGNILYVGQPGSRLAMLDADGNLELRGNWIKPGWVASHGTLRGSILDRGGQITDGPVGFLDEAGRDFRLAESSPCRGMGPALAAAAVPAHGLVEQYRMHQTGETRPIGGPPDLGAFGVGTASGEEAPPEPLLGARARLRVRFDGAVGRDRLTLSGVLDWPAGLATEGAPVRLEVAGVEAGAVLDHRGRAEDDGFRFAWSVSRGGRTGRFRAAFSGASPREGLSDAGWPQAATGQPRDLPFRLSLGGSVFEGLARGLWTAVPGRGGRFR